MTQRTIFALSSGQVPAGIAVIRLSGPEATNALKSLVAVLPKPRQAGLRKLRALNGELLDEGLVLHFPAPLSFTGEDCAELQVHGSRAVVEAIGRNLVALGLRHAEPGEFSKRAFENGRLDLVEVEGLADLVAAETEMQRKLALQTGLGALSDRYTGWAERLTYARAMIEAELDFADEEDAPSSAAPLIAGDLQALRGEMTQATQATASAEIIRNGFKIAIIGAPNAGKSSLMNAMAAREVAIVTDIAGTTRDVLSVDLDVEGYLVLIHDTAGIRDAEDIVEREGIRRAKSAALQADLVLHLTPSDSPPERYEDIPVSTLTIGTKVDVLGPRDDYDLCISTESGVGLDDLRAAIVARARAATRMGDMAGKERHLAYIRSASKFIEDAIEEPRLELKADALRAAGDELGRITGRVDVEDLLDVIFSKFCIGK
jgi:tRNA modification GTPase